MTRIWLALLALTSTLSAAPAFSPDALVDRYCAGCHNDEDKKGEKQELWH